MDRHPGGTAATRSLIERAGLAPGARIIDLGAGGGDAVRCLRALGFDAAGIDLAPGPGVLPGDILSPPFPPESFEAALSQCAFLLTGDVPGALASAHRLLRPGGVLALALYYGKENGYDEKNAVISYLKSLNDRAFTVLACDWLNRKNDPPLPIFVWKE